MRVEHLDISGSYLFEAPIFPDDRGFFSAPFHGPTFREELGFELSVSQTNLSPTKKGAVRGLHYADVPPGQAKYVYAASGKILDVIVDIRVGSPTYLQHYCVELSPESGRGLYIPIGVGHMAIGLSSDAALSYLCSEAYNPPAEHGINPLDPDLQLPLSDWCAKYDLGAVEDLIISQKDRSAPNLAEVAQLDALPSYDDCVAYETSLKN